MLSWVLVGQLWDSGSIEAIPTLSGSENLLLPDYIQATGVLRNKSDFFKKLLGWNICATYMETEFNIVD